MDILVLFNYKIQWNHIAKLFMEAGVPIAILAIGFIGPIWLNTSIPPQGLWIYGLKFKKVIGWLTIGFQPWGDGSVYYFSSGGWILLLMITRPDRRGLE